MEPGVSMPHSQGLSNNSYPEPNQPNSPKSNIDDNDTDYSAIRNKPHE